MIELGSTRERADPDRDGFSTPILAYVAEASGHFFYSVDAVKDSTDAARSICKDYGLGAEKQVNFVTKDGIRFLRLWRDSGVPVDFLYLDAWDHIPGYEKISEEKHLEAFITIEQNMAPDSLVLIDDIKNRATWAGKGRLVIPYLLKNGYEVLFKGYQSLFQKTGGAN
jgi:predicted O-methyltransferase YrrM